MFLLKNLRHFVLFGKFSARSTVTTVGTSASMEYTDPAVTLITMYYTHAVDNALASKCLQLALID